MNHANAEMPTFLAASSNSQALNMNALGAQGLGLQGNSNQLNQQNLEALARQYSDAQGRPPQPAQPIPNNLKETFMARRIVQVFIADPNENVSLDDAILHEGEKKLTDLTDQELFFEIDIKKMLDKHNAKRVKMVDKKVKERTEYLEAAKVRDLKMVVVTVASF